MYLLRTAPCTGSPESLEFDAVLRESLSTRLNIDLGDNRWTLRHRFLSGVVCRY